MKQNTKTNIPAWRKFTTKSGLEQALKPIKSIVRQKCNELHIKLHEIELVGSHLKIYASTKGQSATCPCCGTESKTLHCYRPRKIQYGEVMGNASTVILQIRHFKCKNQECSRKIFSEPLVLAQPYQRSSNEVKRRVLHESLNQASRAAVSTLSLQNINVSQSTCQRMAHKMGLENPNVKTSGYVGLDDFAKRKGHTYMCMIVDHYTGQVLAVFDSRYGEEIVEWLISHPEIKLVTRDGSRCYANLINEASPQIIQVSDRFHLVKNLKEVAVDIVKSMLGKRTEKLKHPYPSESEAYDMIFQDMCEMGDASHRKKVKRYYRIRQLKDDGLSVAEIAEKLKMRPQEVYTSKHWDPNKLLSEGQKQIVKNLRRMAQIISDGTISPPAVYKKLDGAVSSRTVSHCMRSILEKYQPLRQQVREYNSSHKKEKTVKVTAKSIWKYIVTGKTESKKLSTLKETHPMVDKVINVCIDFCKMIHREDGAPGIDEWVEEAIACKNISLTSFAEYILTDKNAIEQACLTNFSNAILEGSVNKAKAIKRSMYNRASPELLRAKLLYSRDEHWTLYHLN